MRGEEGDGSRRGGVRSGEESRGQGHGGAGGWKQWHHGSDRSIVSIGRSCLVLSSRIVRTPGQRPRTAINATGQGGQPPERTDRPSRRKGRERERRRIIERRRRRRQGRTEEGGRKEGGRESREQWRGELFLEFLWEGEIGPGVVRAAASASAAAGGSGGVGLGAAAATACLLLRRLVLQCPVVAEDGEAGGKAGEQWGGRRRRRMRC